MKRRTWEIWSAPEGHREVLYQRFPEFTCLCPRSDYPDFATVHLVTIPDRKVLELKHLKLWLNSFRDRAISHELATAEIVEQAAAQSRTLFGRWVTKLELARTRARAPNEHPRRADFGR